MKTNSYDISFTWIGVVYNPRHFINSNSTFNQIYSRNTEGSYAFIVYLSSR